MKTTGLIDIICDLEHVKVVAEKGKLRTDIEIEKTAVLKLVCPNTNESNAILEFSKLLAGVKGKDQIPVNLFQIARQPEDLLLLHNEYGHIFQKWYIKIDISERTWGFWAVFPYTIEMPDIIVKACKYEPFFENKPFPDAKIEIPMQIVSDLVKDGARCLNKGKEVTCFEEILNKLRIWNDYNNWYELCNMSPKERQISGELLSELHKVGIYKKDGQIDYDIINYIDCCFTSITGNYNGDKNNFRDWI